MVMLMALEVEQPVCWKYTGSSDGARLRPTSSWELDVRWLEEPLVTMISRIVVFEMAYDTTIEVNEPGCPSEVGHPIILCHRANPIVRKFKFRFKFTTISGSHKCLNSTSPPGARCPAVRRTRSPPATTCHWSSPALRTKDRDNNKLLGLCPQLVVPSTIFTDLGLKKQRDV